MSWGEVAQKRLAEIALCSEDREGVTRLPFTPQHHAANKVICGWMRQAGLTPSLDAAATLIGRSHQDDRRAAVLIGSHQDSVRHGGRYDGIMGVALGCLAMEKLRHDGVALPYPVEVLAFADEEGVRFPTALVGPRALAGTLDQSVLEMRDKDGVSVTQGLASFGGRPAEIPTLKRSRASVRAYLEVHIEQGPVLQARGLPLGVVTGICGIERNTLSFTGETGHAGTVPMQGRRDALVAASAFIHRIHDLAAAREDLRATVGTLKLHPDVVNAIPDRVELTLEIRALSDATRTTFAGSAQALLHEIAAARQIKVEMVRTYQQPAVPCAATLTDTLDEAVKATQGQTQHLPSGATHDASAMADLCDIAMLFVRCRDGLSHRPDEYASDEDIDAAVNATAAFLQALA